MKAYVFLIFHKEIAFNAVKQTAMVTEMTFVHITGGKTERAARTPLHIAGMGVQRAADTTY